MSAKVKIICRSCKIIYYRYKIRAGAGFCSMRCWGDFQRSLGRILIPCSACGKNVERFNSRLKKRKRFFCDRICKRIWVVKNTKGENSPNWQGGKTSIAHRFRHSYEYIELRKLVLKRDNYICQICGRRGGKLETDHIKPYSLYPELALDINNCRALCQPCHRSTPTFGGKSLKYSYLD